MSAATGRRFQPSPEMARMILRRRGWLRLLSSCSPLAGSERPSGPPRSGLLDNSGLTAVSAPVSGQGPRSSTLGLLRLSAPDSDGAAAALRGGLRAVGGVAGGGAAGGGGGTRGPRVGEVSRLRSWRSGDLTRLRTRSRTRLACSARGAGRCRSRAESVGLLCSSSRALACSTIGDTRMVAALGGTAVHDPRSVAGDSAGVRTAAVDGVGAGSDLDTDSAAASGTDAGTAAALSQKAGVVRGPDDSGLATLAGPCWRPWTLPLAATPATDTETPAPPGRGPPRQDNVPDTQLSLSAL